MPHATTYTSGDRGREARGLRTRTVPNRARTARTNGSKPSPWNHLDQEIAAGDEHPAGEIERELGEVHGPRLVDGFMPPMWVPDRKYKVRPGRADAVEQPGERRIVQKVALDDVDARDWLHGEAVDRDHPRPAPAHHVLRPGAGAAPRSTAVHPLRTSR